MTLPLAIIGIAALASLLNSIKYWHTHERARRNARRSIAAMPALRVDDEIPEWPPRRVIGVHDGDEVPF